LNTWEYIQAYAGNVEALEEENQELRNYIERLECEERVEGSQIKFECTRNCPELDIDNEKHCQTNSPFENITCPTGQKPEWAKIKNLEMEKIMDINLNITGLDGIVAVLRDFLGAKPVAQNFTPRDQTITAATLGTQLQPASAPPAQYNPDTVDAAFPVYAPPVNQQAPAPQGQQAPAQQQAPPAVQQGVPVSDICYTSEQLAQAGSQLCDDGKIQALQGLFKKYNIPYLMQLPKEQYGAFATDLRALGAKL